jgi:hypothetical protein
MAQTSLTQKHEQTMAKLGHPLQQPAAAGGTQPAAGGAVAAAAPAAQPAKPGNKRFFSFDETRAAMIALQDEGFVFINTVNQAGDISYRYLHPDRREQFIVYVPEKR